MKFKLPAFLKVSNLINNKRFIIFFSILLAFSVWLGISMTENPTRQQTFVDIGASISIEGTAAADMGLGIISDIASQRFSVTVSGPNYVVSSLRPDDFILTASVTDINTAGTHTLEIVPQSNTTKSGYTFTLINPSTIDVTFDYIDTKEFTVIPKLIGVSAAEGLVADTPVVTDSQNNKITVKGPRTVLEKISAVGSLATVNSKLSETTNFDSDIVLYDSNNDIIYRYNAQGLVYDSKDNLITNSMLTLSFNNVKVTQPIYKKASVPVTAMFNNLPEGMSEKDISYKIDIGKVTVIGPPDVIDKTNNISLSAIDFRTVSSTTNVFEVSPTLADGVKILETIDFFTVTIDTSDYAEKVIDVKNIRCTGLSSSLKAKTDSRIRNVKICGPKAVIDNIKATDLYAVVDLTDKSAGDHTLEAVIKSDVYKNIWQIGNYSTSITIS